MIKSNIHIYPNIIKYLYKNVYSNYNDYYRDNY